MAFYETHRSRKYHENRENEEISYHLDDDKRWCGNCKFFDWLSDSAGECKRYPPQLSVVDSLKDVADRICALKTDQSIEDVLALSHERWDCPIMRPTDWCGEFRWRILLPEDDHPVDF